MWKFKEEVRAIANSTCATLASTVSGTSPTFEHIEEEMVGFTSDEAYARYEVLTKMVK